jgi:hypothetical protein
LLNRILGRTTPESIGTGRLHLGGHKEVVGRVGFAGRSGGDEDFSGETGTDRRTAHRHCCGNHVPRPAE